MSKPSWIKPHLAARLLESAAAQTNKSQGATYSDPNILIKDGVPIKYKVDPAAPQSDPNAQLKQELRRIMEGIGLPTLPASSGAPLTRGEQELLKDIQAAKEPTYTWLPTEDQHAAGWRPWHPDDDVPPIPLGVKYEIMIGADPGREPWMTERLDVGTTNWKRGSSVVGYRVIGDSSVITKGSAPKTILNGKVIEDGASASPTSVRTSSGLVMKVGDKVRSKHWQDKQYYTITRFEGQYFFVAFASGAEVKTPYAINNSGWEIEPRVEAWDPMTEPLQVGDKVEVVYEDERYKGKVGTVKYSGTSGTSVFDSNGQQIGAGYWSFRSSLKLLAKAGTF